MPSRIYYRTLDLLAGFGVLLTALPWMMLIVLASWLEHGSPVFYKQRRVGLDGRTYQAIKFRTWRTDTRGNQRVTRVGAAMRRLGFDELPQIFNVLQGNVSLILKNDRTLRF
jgi:lipopolysaccharide/colanic/teichoic acid biosynthesis glycosyltransferase